MQERVEALNEKLDLVLSGGEKLIDGETSAEGGAAKAGYGKKPCKFLVIRIEITSSLHCTVDMSLLFKGNLYCLF